MSTSQYYGLSLSERLSKSGLGDRFSSAVQEKNVSQMKSLLQSLGYSNQSADATIKTFMDDSTSFHL